MGIVTLEHTDRLYWLGRYSERVYTTVKLFKDSYDKMIEFKDSYGEYCEMLDIPNIYTSREDFLQRYCFDGTDPNSIYSNLLRAYDNAVVLREEIGSETLSYIQLAIYEMNRAKDSRAPMLEFQRITDNILAFWGMVDDSIDSENVRNIIKTGKRLERVDMYARLRRPAKDMEREARRLAGRVTKTRMRYQAPRLEKLLELVEQPELHYPEIVRTVEEIII